MLSCVKGTRGPPKEEQSSQSKRAFRASVLRGIVPRDGGWRKVVRFSDQTGLKIPQVGWNQIEIAQPNCPLFRDIPNGSYVYFVHSFFPKPADSSIVATHTEYGETFASSIWRENVFATQFHPEKSQTVGLKLLRNFVELCS